MGEVQTRQPNQRLRGDERESMRAVVCEGYQDGRSIRQLASDHSMSIGLARNLLVEAGISLRPRGGRRRQQGADAGSGGQ